MKYEKFLKKEKEKWFDIETTIGNDETLIERYLQQLNKLFSYFSEPEMRLLEKILKSKRRDFVGRSPKITKKLVNMLLIWRFISKNNLLIISEILNLAKEGRELEKAIFLKIAEDLFVRKKLPHKIYAYCAFRKMGSPTTWLYFHSEYSKDDIKKRLNVNLVSSICRYLTRKLKQTIKLRIIEEIGEKNLFFIAKSYEGKLIRGVKHNKEAQKAVYSLLILDLEKRRVGVISRSKREIFFVHKYLKTKVFPYQLLAPRTDRECNPKDLFKLLLSICQKNPDFQIFKLDLKRSNLSNSPAVRLTSNDGKPINDAISDLENCYKDIGINDLRSIEYLIKDQKANVYSYGKDEWKRRFLNVSSRGKQHYSEEEILGELEKALGLDIKETRFIIEKLDSREIIQKILRDKKILLEPPVPEYVEKLVMELVKGKLLKAPKKISRRTCEDLACRTNSWIDWACPKCGRQMVLFGEEITIGLKEPSFNKILADKLSGKFPDFEIAKKIKQRKRRRKSLIHVVDKKSQVAIYIVTVLSRKDIAFLRALSKEGAALIALCHPQLKSKKDEIIELGSHFIDLDLALDILKKNIDTNDSALEKIFSEAFETQRKQTLERIYARLKDSEKSLREKSRGYNESLFEIDIKNILQALVPKVVRLGTEYTGRALPDGYCSFQRERFNKKYVFGWDAKFSISRSYRLSNYDFAKQRKYIKYLNKGKDPKEAGKLWIYAIISNFDKIDNYKRILRKLSRWREKPRNCKIILLQDDLLVKLADWMLNQWTNVLQKGPEISKTFFKWIRSSDRKKSGRWIYCTSAEWSNLKTELDRL